MFTGFASLKLHNDCNRLNECAGKWSRFARSNDRKVVLPAWVDWVSIEEY